MDTKLSLTELLAKQLLDKLTNQKDLSRVDYLKCKLGLEVFLLNVSKLLVVYSLALFIHSPLEVLIFHSAFMLIRFFAYGTHASSSIVCTIISSVLFIGIPALIYDMSFSLIELLAVNLLNMLILLKYAPGKTKKNYVGDVKRQARLRRNALLANVVLVIGAVFLDATIGKLLIFGGLLCGLMVMPISNKLFTLNFK